MINPREGSFLSDQSLDSAFWLFSGDKALGHFLIDYRLSATSATPHLLISITVAVDAHWHHLPPSYPPPFTPSPPAHSTTLICAMLLAVLCCALQPIFLFFCAMASFSFGCLDPRRRVVLPQTKLKLSALPHSPCVSSDALPLSHAKSTLLSPHSLSLG